MKRSKRRKKKLSHPPICEEMEKTMVIQDMIAKKKRKEKDVEKKSMEKKKVKKL